MNFLTPEERNQIVHFSGTEFEFRSSRDLSLGVQVKAIYDETSHEQLCADIALLIADFMLHTYPQLNGFSGMDTVQFEIVNVFTLQKSNKKPSIG